MIEFELPYNSLMGAWFINDEVCDDMLQSFLDNSSRANRGVIYSSIEKKTIVETKQKDSYDMHFHSDSVFYPFSEYLLQLNEVLNKYLKKYPEADNLDRFGIREKINIQKYPPGGGYKKWHFEEGGHMNRCLVFMTYLNDVTDEGETEFLYQEFKIQPKKGLTLMWPAYWTHTHRGVVSKTQEKYIVTGWYSHL